MAQEASIGAAEQGIRVAKSGYYPSISFGGSIGTSYSDQRGAFVNGSFISTPFGDQLSDNRSGSLRLSLNYNLFDRLSTKNSVESSRVQYENALLDLSEQQQNVAFDIRQAHAEYEAAVKQLDVSEVRLRAAQQALEVEEDRYSIGAATLVELADARSRFVDASRRRVQAIFEFHIRQRLLDYYQGTLDASQPLF
jgi:outer membrane protein